MENIAGTNMHRFTLTDRKGQVHDYMVQEHPAGEGMTLMYELVGLGAPAVLALISAALRAEDLVGTVMATLRAGASEGEASEEGGPEVGTADLSRMLGKAELGAVGQDIAKALATGKAPALTRKILARTLRDQRRLSDEGVFAMAYQANYAELLMAVWKVASINGFFPVPSMSTSSSDERQGSTTSPPHSA